MSKLPIELINLIMSYMSSPIASIFKKDLLVIDSLNHSDREKYLSSNNASFALCFFFNRYLGDTIYLNKSKYHGMDVEEHFSNSKIYYYCNMGEDYINTLIEYNINH